MFDAIIEAYNLLDINIELMRLPSKRKNRKSSHELDNEKFSELWGEIKMEYRYSKDEMNREIIMPEKTIAKFEFGLWSIAAFLM